MCTAQISPRKTRKFKAEWDTTLLMYLEIHCFTNQMLQKHKEVIKIVAFGTILA